MDENEAGEQFHGNEAISAVADEGFLGEEEDDYEDLYNDVNVGENFLQSIRKNEDNLGQRNEQVPENKAEPTPPPRQAPPPVVESRGWGTTRRRRVEVLGVTGGSGSGMPGAGGFRVELKQSSNKPADLEEQTVTNSAPINQQMVQHQQPRPANIGATVSPANVGIVGNVTGTGGYTPGSGVGSGVGGGTGAAAGTGGGGRWRWRVEVEVEVEELFFLLVICIGGQLMLSWRRS
ncbi:RRM domain-containing protein [Abeliophyllum distichum]|uniref:RRM domain-containing protein n=1 Tax=Abeliophyllum distichum TaxID=126358 RepID=A0ABD1PSB2_9LAMI